MAFVLIPGQRSWSGSRDSEGNREYKVVHRVRGLTTDGPANSLRTPGLPQVGSAWLFDDDLDIWAWCRRDAIMTPVLTGEPGRFFDVEQTFSTKPNPRCTDQELDDPLLQPQKVSGGFIKYNEEATHDRFGRELRNSAHEQIRGPQVEFPASRPSIKVEQNVPLLQPGLWVPMLDTVNSVPIWGFPARCVSLANASWEKKYRGQCEVYYTRTFEFETFMRANPILQGVTALAVAVAGTGYAVGDIVVLGGGVPSVPVNIRVTVLDNVGGISSFQVLTPGRYKTTAATLTTFSTTGAGTGATFTPTWGYPTYSGFDRDLIDEGTKALRGGYDRDPASATYHQYLVAADLDVDVAYRNPVNFIRFKDWNGENTRVVLNGKGRPYDPGQTDLGTGTGEDTQKGSLHIERATEANYILLGVPLVI